MSVNVWVSSAIKVAVKSAAARRSEREAEYLEVAAEINELQSRALITAEAERLAHLVKVEHKFYKRLNRGERIYIKKVALKHAPSTFAEHVAWAARTSWEDNMKKK